MFGGKQPGGELPLGMWGCRLPYPLTHSLAQGPSTEQESLPPLLRESLCVWRGFELHRPLFCGQTIEPQCTDPQVFVRQGPWGHTHTHTHTHTVGYSSFKAHHPIPTPCSTVCVSWEYGSCCGNGAMSCFYSGFFSFS